MKTNFKKFLSVVLTLTMVFACFASVSLTASAEEPVTKKGPFDFSDASDLAFGQSATVENGKLKVSIPDAYGAAWIRIPYEIVKGTEYSVRFKAVANPSAFITLKTAYAQNSGVGFTHTNTEHIACENNYSISKTWTEIKYDFAANNPAEGDYKYLGFFIQSSTPTVIYIDNLQIAPKAKDSTDEMNQAFYDFSQTSDLAFFYGTYNSGSAVVEDGKLDISIPNKNYRIETKYPSFVLEDGKTYRVRYELTNESTISIAQYFGYAGPDGADVIYEQDKTYLVDISNGQLQPGTHPMELTFTAQIPWKNWDKFGLMFQANQDNVAFSIDNVSIAEVDPNKVKYDFTYAGDLAYFYGSYNSGSAVVEDGKLNISIPNSNYRIETKYPSFVLEGGKTYRVRYELTNESTISIAQYFGYAGPDGADVIYEQDKANYLIAISNGQLQPGTHPVELTFTAKIPWKNWDKFGLMFQANHDNVAFSIDNVEISVFNPDDIYAENAYYDFSNESHLDYGFASNNPTGISVQDGMLKAQIPDANNRAKMKLPFALKNGETYRVRFDIKADTSKEEIVRIAYAGSWTGEDVIPTNGSNNIAGGWFALTEDFQTLEYTFTANCPEGYDRIGIFITAGSTAGNTIYIDNFYILKENMAPDTPNAPDLESHTENSVTIMDMLGYEYKIDDGEWQDSPVFTGLLQGKTYSFYQRVKATKIYGATASSEAFEYFIANYGDLNRDGEILADDLALLRQVILGMDVDYDEFAANANKDDNIDILDLINIKKLLVQKKKIEFLSGNYQVVWHDEFSGNTLDNTKWCAGVYDIPDNGYGGVTHIAANNENTLKVEDGYLKLNVFAEANGKGGTDYYTPEIMGRNLSFSYGYFEVRAKLTKGNPFWHSFWAVGKNTTEKPYRAEIDVFETNGITGTGNYTYNTHLWWDTTASNLPSALESDNTGHKNTLLYDMVWDNTLTSEFHNYGCEWTDKSLTYYLDGKVIGKVAFDSSPDSDYFIALKQGNPMNLILSLSTARYYNYSIDNASLKNQTMLVDYIRIYQDASVGK